VAAAQSNLGALYCDTEQLGKAVGPMKEALAIRQERARQHPRESEYQAELVISYLNLGILYDKQRQTDQARAAYQEALTIQEQLAREEPAVVAHHSTLAVLHQNLGALYLRTGQFDKAGSAYQQSLAVLEKLVKDHPEDVSFAITLGGTCCDLGNLLHEQNKYAASLDWFARAIGTLEDVLRQEAQQAKARAFLRNSYLGRALSLNGLGRHAEAIEAIDRALERDDGDQRALLQLHRNAFLVNHAPARADAGKQEEALSAFNQAIPGLEALEKRMPGRTNAQHTLARAYARRGSVFCDLGRSREGLKDYDRALALEDGPRRNLYRSLRAAALARLGEHSGAAAEARALAEQQSLEVDVIYNLACIYSLAAAAAGRDAQLTGAEQAKAVEDYGGRGVAVLAKAAAAGLFQKPSDLEELKKDKDLDALRSRADFQKLLAALEAKAKPSGK
jgi:tetratricopeptide (TPR) repeat protein